ncbi:MAG: AMP-binding protein [Rikenellaceae bacterium]
MLKENLIKIYEEKFRENSELPALKDYFKSDSFTYLELSREIAKLHLLFDKMEVKPGDKIALIGRNNPRWCISYLATITYGAIIVPILQDFNPNDVINIINHSESRMIFLGDNFWDVMEEDRIPMIEVAISLTDFSVIYESGETDYKKFQKNVDALLAQNYPNGYKSEDIKFPEVPNDAPALLNYTSGTTGSSKGVILTVNNLTGNVIAVRNFVNVDTGDLYFRRGGRTLSFLPLAHAYGCAFDFLAQLAVGASITLLGRIPTPKILLEAMAKVKPTIVCCVPLILEKVYRKQIMPLLEKSAMSIAMKIPLLNSAIYSVIKSKLLDAFGGEVGLFVVGGAPMNQETEAFLMTIGFPITIGYGMTECAPLISFTPHDQFKASSCGKVLSSHLEVKIMSSDPQNVPGEILVRGEHVMIGYYKNDEATAAVLDKEGWLHTGDMGVMDDDDTLYIRGRCKTMILSASGQNIYPEQIEDRLNNMYLVGESLIIDNNGRLDALVVPDYELLQNNGVTAEELNAVMERNLKELNSQVANYEKVASITLFEEEFEKTPKKSIKRYLYDTTLLTKLNS